LLAWHLPVLQRQEDQWAVDRLNIDAQDAQPAPASPCQLAAR